LDGALDLMVLAPVGRNHLLYVPGFQLLALAEAIDPGFVGYHCEPFGTSFALGGYQGLGIAKLA
ncbi:hypothetical protein, partial [Stenotrophomonas maltophilia]|uniref:hypothetical protein n=1 Tax=Stenotrophomonas maltophilia TaxID=40324 RepID=UPI003CCFEEB6